MKIQGKTHGELIENTKIYFSDFENLSYGVAVIYNDACGTVIEANSAFYDIIGHTRDEFFEEHKNCITEILDNDFLLAFKKNQQNKEFYATYQITFKRKDGKIRKIHNVIHYNDKLDTFIATYIDISDILKSKDLNDTIKGKTHIIELIPQAIIAVDIKNREIMFSNEMANNLFSLSDGKSTINQILIDTSTKESLREAVKKDLETNEKSVINHVRLKTSKGIDYYDIHFSYVDDTKQAIYLIFAFSVYELERMINQRTYYNNSANVPYSYPFRLDVKKRRMEFFKNKLNIDFKIPHIIENFPEPIFDYNFIYEEDIDEYKLAIEKMYNGEKPRGSFRFYDNNGNLVRYGLKYVVNRDENGQPVEIVGDFVIKSPAQTELEYSLALKDIIHKCMDVLFTVSATSQDSKIAYTTVIKEIKDFYRAEGTYFYKFIDKTNTIERVHTLFDDNLNGLEQILPNMLDDEQLKIMHILSKDEKKEAETELNLIKEKYINPLFMLQKEYNINNFESVPVKDVMGNTVGFVGVINPKIYKENKELMTLLTKPLCMFIEFQKELELRQQLLKLESISKEKVVTECTNNFKEFAHSKEHITAVLTSLCSHYEGDYAITLTNINEEKGNFEISYIGGYKNPDVQKLQSKKAFEIKRWQCVFAEDKNFITDLDLPNNEVKEFIKNEFGIFSFIASPIKDEHNNLTGLLCVMNYKITNRSKLLTHIVANNISDYLQKINLYEQKNLEPMTKLFNKIATEKKITKQLDSGVTGVLFFIDMDKFKDINDTLGHYVGDEAIVCLANNLKKFFRASDILGRIGGDEFMVFCPKLTSDKLITQKAEQILEIGRTTYEKDGIKVETSVSVGVCVVDETKITYDALYEKADQALYCAKRMGRDQYYI